MSIWNGPYSAPKGYDIRAAHNVPLGEVQTLRVVRPFSISSTQRNTVVEGFPGEPPNINSLQGFPRLKQGDTFIQVKSFNYCSGCLELSEVSNQWPPHSERTLMKLYLKESRIK